MNVSKIGALLLLGFVGACTAALDGGPEGADDRQPLGKADNIGSCQGPGDTDFCGGQSNGTCYCDEACVQYGDCCGDVSAVCEGDGVEPGDLCLSDDTCLPDQVCDHSVCLNDCEPGEICPAVCLGECVDDTSGDCGDGTLGLCPALPPVCAQGTASFIVDNCWGPCVDPSTCEPPVDPVIPCSDGSFPVCKIAVAPCEEGLVREITEGCFGACVDPSTCEPPNSCDEIVDAFMEETAEVRSCNVAADCGQVLAGTSCGCTNNWVARADADVEAWYEMREDVWDADCNIPGGISTCDCPATDGFACEDNVCTWNYL